MSKKSLEGGKIELSEVQKDEQVVEVPEKKPSGMSFDPSLKPSHWADASILYGFSKTVDLEAQIQKKFDAAYSKATMKPKQQSVESSAVNLNAAEQSLKELNSATTQQVSGQQEKAPDADEQKQAENAEEEEEDAPAEEEKNIPEGHYLLGYGPKTIEMVQQAIDSSFKLFWDGSVGMYIDTVIASRNN